MQYMTCNGNENTTRYNCSTFEEKSCETKVLLYSSKLLRIHTYLNITALARNIFLIIL